jgi:lauroyl/myristoyl acyltransferase
MGEVWIRTISHSLVRAERVTEIASSRGSVHEERGYSIKAVAEGKAYILVDNSDLEGSPNSRFGHASRMQAGLLLAVEAASAAAVPMVVSYEQDGERWIITAASDVAGLSAQATAAGLASEDHHLHTG